MSARGVHSEALDLIYEQMPPAPDGSVDVQHFFGAGHYMRVSEIPAGRGVALHAHDYDHLSIVAAGRGRLLTKGGVREIRAGETITVAAGERHAYVADENTLWICIHPTTEAEAQKLYGVKG
jgi:quercetin dioxygenase-like cupin family protein